MRKWKLLWILVVIQFRALFWWRAPSSGFWLKHISQTPVYFFQCNWKVFPTRKQIRERVSMHSHSQTVPLPRSLWGCGLWAAPLTASAPQTCWRQRELTLWFLICIFKLTDVLGTRIGVYFSLWFFFFLSKCRFWIVTSLRNSLSCNNS